MDLRLLKTFLTVAKLENITQAAEELSFTQPTVTSQIQALEDMLGVFLFERVGKKLRITEAGRKLIQKAEQILDLWEQTKNELSYYSRRNTIVSLGISTHIMNYYLPPVIRSFQNNMPDGVVNIHVYMNLKDTVNALLNNKFNLGLVHDEVKHERLIQYRIMSEELIWVGSQELYAKYKYSQNVLAYPFINYTPGTVFRDKFDDVLKGLGIKSLIECSDTQAVKQAVLDGLGIALLPKTLIRDNLQNKSLIRLSEAPQLELNIYVVFKNAVNFSPSIYNFLMIMSELPEADTGIKDFLVWYKQKNSTFIN